jgi:hypothetical protein
MVGAVQALYADAKLAIKVEGRVGEVAHTHTRVRQGCPLNPTFFGEFIDALEPWLLDHVGECSASFLLLCVQMT